MITDILMGCIGWVVGMLVNYLADIMPLRRKLVQPFCIACDQPQGWIRYAIWPRQCQNCGYRRVWRVWVVDIVYVLLAVWLWNEPVEKLGFPGGMLLLAYFGLVVVIDMEYRLIMHPISIVGAVITFGLGSYLHGIVNTLLGGAAGFGIMWGLYMFGALIVRLISRLRGQVVKDVALGFGDVILSGVLGLLLGWPSIWVGLLLAITIAGMVSLIYLLIMIPLRKYHLFSTVPYGPFLIAGAVLVIFFKNVLIRLFS